LDCKQAELFKYDEEFYRRNAKGSLLSAKSILNLLYNKINLHPTSVLDVGCGVGTWLSFWFEQGVDVYGIDGNSVNEKYLCVSRSKIQIQDLNFIKKTDNKKYDLVMSLEVAEHLRPENSENFVNFLAVNSDFILFSAGIPHQIGDNHINCRPLDFWVDEFSKYGLECFDIIRPHIIANIDNFSDVEPWYIQNILIFARNAASEKLKSDGFHSVRNPLMFYAKEFTEFIYWQGKAD
jgi:SAM-dependent methyltransferase